jgi:hypothetical protein
MRRFSRRQYLIAVAAAAVVVGGSGVAYAYWSASGSGSGSAKTASGGSFAVTTDTATGGPLSPGGPAQTVPVHVKNTGSGHSQLSTLTVAVANPDGSAWTATPGCSAADYTVAIGTFAATDLAPNDIYNTTATVTMKNLATNQDACKGVTVPLYFVAS